MKTTFNTKREDILVSQLCNEIDYWKQQALHYKEEAEHWENEANKLLKQSLKTSQQGIANALIFALNVVDQPNGDLVIPNEKRKNLKKHFKNKKQNDE